MTSEAESWPSLPTETEIYILPSGEIVVADLPAELAAQIDQLTNPAWQAVIEDASPAPSDLQP
jgi:hypothetical protein